MKFIQILISASLLGLCAGCALDEPDVDVQDQDFPFRLVFDSKEGAAIAGESDYEIDIEFADFIGDLPSNEITLSYALTGSEDFSDVSIDEIIYEYESDECKFNREVVFTATEITIPVDVDLGTVPDKITVVAAFSESAENGDFTFEITGVSTSANVVFNDENEFTYEVLSNDLAGAWVYDFVDATDFGAFVDVFGPISPELDGLNFSDVSGSIAFEFEFEEMKLEIELVETEMVESCEDGETTIEEENLVVEIEVEYKAEDGEFEWEGKFVNEDGEEVDFLITGSYAGDLDLTIDQILDKDGENLITDSWTRTLIAD